MNKLLLSISFGLNIISCFFYIQSNRDNIFVVIEPNQVEILSEPNNFFLIDCRSSFVYNQEHAKGSVNITLADIVSNPEKVFSILKKSRSKDLLFYCSSSNCNTSQKVAEYLRYSGRNIYVYKGGWHMMREFVDIEKQEQ